MWRPLQPPSTGWPYLGSPKQRPLQSYTWHPTVARVPRERRRVRDASGRITTMTTTCSSQRRPRWPTTSRPSCVRRCTPGSLHNSALSAILCLCQIDHGVAKTRKNGHGARHEVLTNILEALFSFLISLNFSFSSFLNAIILHRCRQSSPQSPQRRWT